MNSITLKPELNELYTLNELDRYTFFLERNYN